VVGTIAEAILYFYDSLILLHKMEEQPLEDNIKYPEDLKISLSRIEENQKNLRLWSEFAGMNHLHRYVLVEAEIFRVSGKFLEASNSYDRAIELAHKNGFIQDEAIANELAFRFWLRQNKKDFAQLYLQKAYYSYSLWGATKKLENLQLTYPSQVKLINDFQENAFNTGTIISGMTTTGKMEANLSLDFMSIMKASQIISGEIILEKLISSLMKVLVENAGAEKGVLFLEDDGEISVVAKWESKLKAVDILNIPADNGYSLYSPSVVNFVSRTSKNLVIENLARDEKFKDDYITKYNPNSVLCIPLIKQGKLIGIIYLENNLTSGAFTKDRIEIIKMLSSQAAISLENARLYSNLENITKEKTKVITEMEIARDIQTSLLHLKIQFCLALKWLLICIPLKWSVVTTMI
jgi:GAF domain-containing protein